MENYKQLLNEAGIKPTIQRIKILEFLDNTKSHPTADAIYSALYEKVPTLSKATVYNTLDILRQKKMISAISITESELHYDMVKERHQHFLCTQCGKILDVSFNCARGEMDTVEGHQVAQHLCYFRGICRNCLKENASNKSNT